MYLLVCLITPSASLSARPAGRNGDLQKRTETLSEAQKKRNACKVVHNVHQLISSQSRELRCAAACNGPSERPVKVALTARHVLLNILWSFLMEKQAKHFVLSLLMNGSSAAAQQKRTNLLRSGISIGEMDRTGMATTVYPMGYNIHCTVYAFNL